MFAQLHGINGRLHVNVIGTAIVKQVNIPGAAIQHIFPIIRATFAKAIALDSFSNSFLAQTADHIQTGDRWRGVHHVGDLLVGIGVRFAHKGIAQHTNPDLRDLAFGFGCGHRGETSFLSHDNLPYFLASNAASKATFEGEKSCLRIIARASGAPHSRSMPLSSHSMESGPL
jgi:hypothetical protein